MSEHEWAEPADVAAGASVLAQVLRGIAFTAQSFAAGYAERAMTEIVREHYRDAMARLGAAVSIVTTDGPAGRAGFTASAVCSVTDDPPTLLVCMNRSHLRRTSA